MKKIIYVFLFLTVLAAKVYATPTCPSCGPHLWLSTDPNKFDAGGVGYVYSSSNPWETESYVTSNNPFKMYLYNALQNNDSPDAMNIGLMVTIHSGESGTVTIKDEFGNITVISTFTETNINPYYGGGNHGVYLPHDGVFAIYHPGEQIDLASGKDDGLIKKSTWFEITVSGFSEVHFDAFTQKLVHGNLTSCFYNPASHDVTYKEGRVIPEPATLSLLGLGLLGLAFRARKRREK